MTAVPMTLDPQSKYPGARSYVLKLHRDARPQRGALAGRLENMVTGSHHEFSNGEQLLALLANDLDSPAPPRASE